MALWMALGLIIGVATAWQAGINAQLRTHLNSSAQAALVSFFIGTLTLFIYTLFQKEGLPLLRSLGQVPPLLWIGGVLGAVAVTLTVILASRLGALSLAVTVICGQILASIVFDHFGWVGYEKYPITVQRLAGAGCVIAGLFLVMKR